MLTFAAGVMKLIPKLSRTVAGRYVAGQLMRASASSGANYQEACGAESRADFIHKLQIVVKELRESRYWVRLMGRSGLVSEDELRPLSKEADELTRIIAKSVVTARSKLESV
jgi:four helix bundle protein